MDGILDLDGAGARVRAGVLALLGAGCGGSSTADHGEPTTGGRAGSGPEDGGVSAAGSAPVDLTCAGLRGHYVVTHPNPDDASNPQPATFELTVMLAPDCSARVMPQDGYRADYFRVVGA